MDQGVTISVKMEEDLDKDVDGTLPSKLLKGLGPSEGGNVKYAYVMCCSMRKGRCCGLGWK